MGGGSRPPPRGECGRRPRGVGRGGAPVGQVGSGTVLTPCCAPGNHELKYWNYPCFMRALSAPRRRGARGVNSALTAP